MREVNSDIVTLTADMGIALHNVGYITGFTCREV